MRSGLHVGLHPRTDRVRLLGANVRMIVNEFISLDGVVQAPGGAEEDTDGGFTNGGWSMPFFDPESMGAAIGEAMASTEVLLFGRRTWRVMADAWPERAGDAFADELNAMPKYVASRTLTEADLDWNTTLLPADGVIAAVEELRARDGGDVCVMGSATLVRELVANDLVDEYNLMIEPIVLGGGKSIFPTDGTARPLELISTRTASTGVLICTYRPAAA
jgi:dihydrofolate reductase